MEYIGMRRSSDSFCTRYCTGLCLATESPSLEEEEDEPLASDAPKSDAKRKSDDGKSGDIELGRRCAGSMPTYWRHSLALLMSRAH